MSGTIWVKEPTARATGECRPRAAYDDANLSGPWLEDLMRKAITLLFIAGLSSGIGCATTISTRGETEGQESVWVCHGNRNPRWQRVAAPAADAHRRHGDRVSDEPREQGAACQN